MQNSVAGERGTCVEKQKGTTRPLVSADINTIKTRLKHERLPVLRPTDFHLVYPAVESEIQETTLSASPSPSAN